MLSSFRNGPIKVIGNHSHASSSNIGKQRVPSAKQHTTASTSGSQSLSSATRPSSAPAKRPPSPSTGGGHHHGAGSLSSSNQTSNYNRVKYSKGTSGQGHQMTSGSKGASSGGITGSGIGSATHIGNQLRNGLNPTLRGYSPSRPRWKVATAAGNNNNY